MALTVDWKLSYAMKFGLLPTIGEISGLGARSAEVLRMVLGETSLLAGVGVALGICGAIVATKLVASMLYGLRATDSLTFATAALLLLAVGLLASIAPAWRAATIDPVNALRHE